MKCNVSDKLYIDRTAAIMTAMDYDGNGNAQDASQDIASALSGIPAADVVEVVRCRECKHYHGAKDSFGWCENIESPAWDRGVDSDWFCADGKRRGNA